MTVSVKMPLSSSFLFEMSRINKHISSRSPQNIVLCNEKNGISSVPSKV